MPDFQSNTLYSFNAAQFLGLANTANPDTWNSDSAGAVRVGMAPASASSGVSAVAVYNSIPFAGSGSPLYINIPRLFTAGMRVEFACTYTVSGSAGTAFAQVVNGGTPLVVAPSRAVTATNTVYNEYVASTTIPALTNSAITLAISITGATACTAWLHSATLRVV